MRNTSKEEWKKYKDTNYFVSNYGEIRRKLKSGRWRYLNTKAVDRYGYPKITISVDGKNKTINIHRMVAELFVPNPEGKPQVNHINGDKENNRFTNLEWVSAEENMQHCYTKLHNRATKPIIRMSADLREFKLFPSVSNASQEMGLAPKTITEAAGTYYSGGKQWKAGGFYWHYLN